MWRYENGRGLLCNRAVAGVVWSLLVFLALFWPQNVLGQLPAVCANNATKQGGMCCPTPPGLTQRCGGYPRGKCAIIYDNNEDYIRGSPETAQDDRFHWPLNFFQYGCECYGNYAGYMCHECKYGFTGYDCSLPITRVRRDFKTLLASEKRYILDLFEKARRTESDYVLIDVSKGADPVENISFVPSSVYDYLAYVHYYASRKTIFRLDRYPGNATDFRCDQPHFESLDFAHRGTNFPIWHRYYMMLWEKEMQKLSGNIYFTFPYWNWTDAGTHCEVCTDDFLGSHDETGRINPGSPVSQWYALCLRQQIKCEDCDPSKRYLITRSPGKVAVAPSLPTSATVNFALAQDVYDYPDYTTSVPNASFRGCLEGFVGIPKGDVYRLHNEVHMFFGGVLNSATSASWDPIFYFHHSFMDKLLEIWLRRTKAGPSQLPLTGAPPGHHRNSRLMAFFPVQESALYFRPSTELGYTYDDMITPPLEHKEEAVSTATSAKTTTEAHVTKTHQTLNLGKHRVSPSVPDLPDTSFPARLLQTVAVETALIVLLLLVLISICGQTFLRKRREYTRVPSEDPVFGLDSTSLSLRKDSPQTDCPSDSEADFIKP